MPDLTDDVGFGVDGFHPLAEFLPEGIIVDLGGDIQPPAIDPEFDPVFGDLEEKGAHGGRIGI